MFEFRGIKQDANEAGGSRRSARSQDEDYDSDEDDAVAHQSGPPEQPPSRVIPRCQLTEEFVRKDCLDYVRAVAFDYVTRSLVNRVSTRVLQAERLSSELVELLNGEWDCEVTYSTAIVLY